MSSSVTMRCTVKDVTGAFEEVAVSVSVDPSYPDALDEARSQCLRAFTAQCLIAWPQTPTPKQGT